MTALPEGVRYLPGYLDLDAQRSLVDAIRAVVAEAPLYTPEMPKSGKPMSVRMTNCGELGWVTDRDGGYRYQASIRSAAGHGHRSRNNCSIYGAISPISRCRRRLALSISIRIPRRWVSIRIATKKSLPRPCSPSRLAMIASSASAVRSGAIRPSPSGCEAAISLFWAAKAGSPSTASTASIPKHRRCCRKAAGSISRCGG